MPIITGRLNSTALRRSCPAMGLHLLLRAELSKTCAVRTSSSVLLDPAAAVAAFWNCPVSSRYWPSDRKGQVTGGRALGNVARLLRPEWAAMPQSDFLAKFRQLNSLPDLAEFLDIAPTQLYHYAYRTNKNCSYSTFEVPRRSGGMRRIDAPVRTLKFIQRLIHESLSRVYRPHRAAHGFLADRSIVTNAWQHMGRRYVLNVDL